MEPVCEPLGCDFDRSPRSISHDSDQTRCGVRTGVDFENLKIVETNAGSLRNTSGGSAEYWESAHHISFRISCAIISNEASISIERNPDGDA